MTVFVSYTISAQKLLFAGWFQPTATI